MPGYRMDFSDVGGDTASDSSGAKGRGRAFAGGGCRVSPLVGFVLLLLVLVLVAGVALVVFFAASKDLTCSLEGASQGSEGGIQGAVTSCKEWVENGGAAAEGICSACPSPYTTTPSTDTSPGDVTTTAPPYDRKKYRLPSSVIPSHYTLRLQPHFYGSNPSTFSFEGSVTIDVMCHNVTNDVTLHADGLAILDSDVTVKEKLSGLSVSVRNISYEKEPGFVHIRLAESLRRGLEYQLIFAKFSGPMTSQARGLYYTSYKDGDRVVYVAATYFWPSYARKAFPCFDEPAMKARFDVTLLRKTDTAGRNYRTRFNTKLLRTDSSSGWEEDVYETTMVTSTYPLALLVSDFDHVSNTTMGVEFNVWSRPNGLQYTNKALELGTRFFEALERTFDPDYSTVLPKLDNVAVPGFGNGAMEHWGIIFYGDSILFRPHLSTLSSERFIGRIFTHEISHMWFGNLVTLQWWYWLWLNEAMASFLDMTIPDMVHPSWRMTEERVVTNLHSIMTSDALSTSRPLTADVETTAEVNALLDGITYRKGPFIIRMMYFIMGHDKFITALNNYLNDHKFRNVNPQDLWKALNHVGPPGVDMAEKMEPWVSQMGYPIVTVTRSGSGMLELSQKRFLVGSLEGTDDRYKDAPFNYRWDIPITMATSQNPNFTKTSADIVWMNKDSPLTTMDDPTVGEEGGWYLMNVQQYGYYRVQYDHSNWMNLIAQLNKDHTVIHPINRAQIINDAWNLAKVDMLAMDTALKTADYLAKELDYLPWKAFASEMSYVGLMLHRSELFTDLQNSMLKLVGPPLQKLGLDISSDTKPLDVYVRTQLASLACSYGHTTCVNAAQQQFENWRTSGKNGIDVNFRSQFYCTAVERGAEREWSFVWQQLQAEQTDHLEKPRLRQALACTKEPSLLRRLMQMALNGSQSLDAAQTFTDLSTNRWAHDIAFHFVVEHFSLMAERLGSRMNGVIGTVTAHFNTHVDLQRLNMLGSVSGASAYGPALEKARRQTQSNMAWLQKHQSSLRSWLQKEQAPPERINYRLPGQMVPSHYKVELQPHIYGNDSSSFFFRGWAQIRARCTRATDQVTVHTDRLTMADSAISVRQTNSQKELFQSSSYDPVRHFLHLRLKERLQAEKDYVLTFSHFTGPLTTDGTGLYLSHYRDGAQTIYLATTQMEPVYARKTFPCFDEPQLKATFDITLLRRNDTERNYISLANAPQLSTEYMEDDEGHKWAKDRFQTSPKMPTYLLAFIVCDYPHLQNTTASDPNVTYRTLARPNAIQWAERAQQYGLRLFDWMDRRFKPQYGQALSKLDNIAVPDFNFGAMENWGLITYREALLYQPGVTSASYEFWMASVITHELAHMWFGDYVSPKWWHWLWLNEAFASWWDVFVTQQVFPTWQVVSDWASSSVYSVMESDALSTSHPMTADVESPTEIGAIFDGVTYNKGSAVVRMMHFIMGLDTFINGLNHYLASNLYGNAEASDLFSALDQKMWEQNFPAKYMTDKMDPWVSQMGFPVVMVTRTPQGYNLTQKRFVIGSQETTDDRYKDAPYDYQWEIPIIYASRDQPAMKKSRDDIRWLNKNSHLMLDDSTVNDTQAWILLNINRTAYCRVLYDTDTWHALIGQLKSDPSVIPDISRGQIINDAWNLAKAGMLDMSVALSTLDFLQQEKELAPWRAFAREMHYVELMLESTPLFPLLQTYLKKTLQDPLQSLSLNIDDDMVPTDVFVRTLIAQYSCNYGLVGCVNVAKRLFSEWKNTGENAINANLRRQFYCTAVAEGDVTDWDHVYKQYKSSDDTTELTNLRHALSCSRDQVLLRKLLAMSLDTAEIRTQDIASTIQYVAANPRGRDLAFQFFVDNFELLQKRLEVLYFGRVLVSVTSHFNTDYHLQQLQQLSQVRDVTAVSSVLEQTITQTRSNMAWLQTHYDVIQAWLTPSQPTTPAPPAPGSYRLPTHLTPERYELSLQPDIYGPEPKDFFFTGNVTITFRCSSPTSVITLHQDRLTIDSEAITVSNVRDLGTSLPVADVTEDRQFHFYKIHMAQSLVVGERYRVQIPNFRGDIRTSGEGLYLSSYKDGDRTIYLATTQMEATYARQVFPCFDEPALKATFSVALRRRVDTDRNYITLFNTPNISSIALDGSWVEDRYEESMKMPTYLLAFIVCDYSYLSNRSSKYNVETRTYARPNRIEDARVAQNYSVELLDWFDDHFDPNYETYLPKVDHIAIPDFTAGAMENWGLITYRERLLYNAMSGASDRNWVAEVPSHELAHMWFGNKVSPKWWTWLWLNEAFADYLSTYAVEQLYPDWKASSVVDMAAGVFYAMQIDSYFSSHPLSNVVETPAEIDQQFDTITYTKGGAIIGMMHMIMGEHFIPSLNVYLDDHLLGSAEHKDLFDSMNKYVRATPGIDVNVTEKMEPWVTQMGYPVVSVHRQGNQMQLSQKRFLMGEASATDTGTYGYMFEVPITYTTSSEKNFNKSRLDIEWLRVDGTPLAITLPSSDDEWVVVNLRHEGYYRVNYDVTTWKALIAQLNADHTVINEINRAALLDDAFNLVKAELLPLEIALQTLDYMKKETSYGPWRVFARETSQMELLLERSDLFSSFQSFMQELVTEPIREMGFDLPANNDPPIQAFKMSWILSDACKYGQAACVAKAKSLVSDWINGLGNAINVNLRNIMYCTAVREGDYSVWQFVYTKYQAEKDTTEKARLRSALGCSKDPAILFTFLDMCLYEEEVPRSETPSCLNSVAGNRYGRDVAFTFLQEHFPELRKRFSTTAVASMVGAVTEHFQTNFHLLQLQFLRDTYDVSGMTNTLNSIRQRTLINMKWLDNNFPTVRKWLEQKSASSSGPASSKLDYRLPTSVTPSHYDLELRPEMYGLDPSAFTFSGKVTIALRVREPTRNVTLHAHPEQLDQQTIRESARLLFPNGSDSGLVQEVTFDAPRHFLILALRRELRANESFGLYLEFRGALAGNGVGLYYTSYLNQSGSPVYLATTKFEAPYARRAFPCFDEPALKATVNTTLVRRGSFDGRTYRSWSNNDLWYTEDRGNNTFADHFLMTPITSTYLLAFIVADFQCLTNVTRDGLKYSTCARPHSYQHGQLAQNWGVRQMEKLEEYFSPDYSMPKLDNMAIPDFLSGAMENWGLITYREAILYEEGVTSASDKSWTAEVVAHELAHMWFGNIVSPQWWNWLWLNEAFASYWDFSLVDILEPELRKEDQFVAQSMHAVMSSDSLTSSHPLTADVESPSEIQSIFDSITYSKGAAIVRMMDFIMGRSHFIAALNVYLEQRQYDVANHTHLFDALDQYLTSQGQSLRMSEVMEPWVTQMGLPVVHVHWSGQGQVTLTQQRFLSNGQGEGDSSDSAPFGYTWDIPVTMATSSNMTYDVSGSDITWFKRSDPQAIIRKDDIPAPPTEADTQRWVMVNVKQYGYYRVNYPRHNWLSLIQTLKANPNAIPPINRAQVINDAWSLARSGHLGMDIALQTLQVLKNDQDYVPWRAMSGELHYLDLMLSRTETYGMFEDYMVELVNATYHAIGMTSDPNDEPIDIFQRQRIMSYACKYGVQACRHQASQLFQAWKQNPQSNRLNVDLRGTILCNGIRFGDKSDWETVFERYGTSDPGSEQYDLLMALTCTSTPWLLQRLMTLTLNSTVIMAQDVRGVLQSVSANPIGREAAFTFLLQNFQQLTKFMTTGSFGRMIVSLTQHFNTQSELDTVKQFMNQNDVSMAMTSLRQVVEQTSVNMKWMENYYHQFRDFLQDRSNW